MFICYSDDCQAPKDGNLNAEVDPSGNILMLHTSVSRLTSFPLTTAESLIAHLVRYPIVFVSKLGWRIDQVLFATQLLEKQLSNYLSENACNSGAIRRRHFK